MTVAEMTRERIHTALGPSGTAEQTEGHDSTKVVVADLSLCNGCSYCHPYLFDDGHPLEIDTGSAAPSSTAPCIVLIDEPVVLCSNMRVRGPVAHGRSAEFDAYRLTAGDIVLCSELGV